MKGLFARIADAARASPGELGLAALLGALVVGGAAFVYAQTSAPLPPPPIEHVAATEPAPAPLLVHVSGMVASPGVYELRDGSRVKDAIDAAGGAVEGGDLDALNLAALLSDGLKIYVPKKGEAPSGSSEGSGVEDPSGKVNLNSATKSQLEELPGIGPVLAERIIAYRQKKGRFTSVRQLLEVEGIGPKKYESLKDLVSV